ncbi:MAG: ATP-dependent Clp protease ATP-binding subunit ClpX [Clostridium sp.]|nr:ATP-dependent Clp protease ATP-binding subunit ClpX [Clostridium sp.]
MSDSTNHNNEYEDVCMLCRRPESKAGRMFHLPNNICICDDCMHSTMDAVSQMEKQGLFNSDMMSQLNNPYFASFMLDAMSAKAQEEHNTSGKKEEKERLDAQEGAEGGAASHAAESGEAGGASAAGSAKEGAADQNKADAEDAAGTTSSEQNDAAQNKQKSNKNITSDNIDFGKGINGRGFFPNIQFVNLADLQGEGIPFRQKVKKRKKSEQAEPILNLKDIPAPHKIREKLDEYVVGQDQAKKVISVAVYNHYKRVATNTMDEIEIEKSNILMIGPTGCGKTYLVKTLARLLDVPLAIADATSLTEAGYIGDDIESVISKLLAAADNDVDRAERGIVFIDEIDKIAKKKETTSRDVSGESVQQGMLKLLEGAEVEVPVGANSKNAMVPLATVNTRNILFICGGAFPDLEEIIKQRLRKQTSIGFAAELKDKYDKERELLEKVTVEDLRQFGLIPEFIGRLPILCTLKGLNKEEMMQILSEPKNALLKQYQRLLELDEVKLEFDQSALEAIADKAMERDTGARALRAIIEEFMLDIMYEVPKDDNIGRVVITRDYIEGKASPLIEIRSNMPTALLPPPRPAAEAISAGTGR